jgi:hypothetical protein
MAKWEVDEAAKAAGLVLRESSTLPSGYLGVVTMVSGKFRVSRRPSPPMAEHLFGHRRPAGPL